MRESTGDGREAMKLLKTHYAGKGNVRLIALWTELTSLEKLPSESITDYILKAEKAATSLKNASQTVSDPLLIAMMMKGLPEQYKPFCVVTTQNEVTEMSKFKVNLRSFEETERVRGGAFDGDDSSSVMKARFGGGYRQGGGKQGNDGNRYRNRNNNKCRTAGHKARDCKKKWCGFCNKSNHNESECRNKQKSQANMAGGGSASSDGKDFV